VNICGVGKCVEKTESWKEEELGAYGFHGEEWLEKAHAALLPQVNFLMFSATFYTNG